jgi:adhesin transport system outer membrane protein
MNEFVGLLRSSILVVGLIISQASVGLDLNDAVKAAYQYVPLVRVQQSRIDAAFHEVGIAQSVLRPQVGIDAVSTYGEYDNLATRGQGFEDFTNSDSYRVDLSVRQRLFDYQASTGEIRAAKYLADAEQGDLDQLKEVIAGDVIDAYIDVLRFTELLVIAGENLEMGESLSKLINKQVEKGRSAEVEQHLADSQVASAASQHQLQRELLEQAKVRFYELTGLSSNGLEPINSVTGFAGMSTESDIAAISYLLADRPDVKAAQSQVEAANAVRESRGSAWVPKIDLEGFVGSGKNENAVLGRDDSYGVNLTIRWDLYQGGRNISRERQSLAQLAGARQELAERYRVGRQDVQLAFTGLNGVNSRLTYLTREVEANENVYYAYRQQLVNNRRSPIDVFVVLNSFNQSRIAVVDLQYQRLARQYEIVTAFGQLNNYLGLKST